MNYLRKLNEEKFQQLTTLLNKFSSKANVKKEMKKKVKIKLKNK